MTICPFVFHAANATGDARDFDDRSAGGAGRHRGKHDLFGRPADVRPFALVELSVAAIGDAVEALDRIYNLGIVLQQQVVAIQFHLDGIEHVHRMTFVRPDQADELAVPVEHSPDAGAFTDRRLARPARHRHREQSAAQDRLLDLADHFQMVRRPGQMERQRKVRIAKETEVRRRPRFSIRFHDFRQFADVATGDCERHVASASPFFQLLVRITVGL
ncbi:MAG: hypothetical protein RIC55_27630 [Pirellulaceae bacterium]